MRRRSFLAAGSLALAGLAGCMGGDGPSTGDTTTAPGDGTTTTSPGDGTTTTPDDRTTGQPTTTATPLSVSVLALQPGVVEMSSPDSTAVRAGEDTQFLFLSVSAPETAPALTDLAVRFDGGRYTPVQPRTARQLWRDRETQRYGEESTSGWVLFELPASGDASEAALTWPGGEWSIPESTRARLAAPLPTLSPAFEIPERLPVSQEPTLTLTVENEETVPGTFVAAIDRAGPSVAHIPAAQVRERVPAGETVSVDIEDSFYSAPGGDEVGDGEPDATYYVSWPGGSNEWTVELVEATTTAGG